MVDGGAGGLEIVIQPHWVNKWILIPFTVPYARVDGVERRCAWNVPANVSVSAGDHVVETFIRYKRFKTRLGIGHVAVTVPADTTVRIRSRNGWSNQHPFTPEVR